MYIHIYVCMYVCNMYVCMFLCIYVCMYLCMYLCICTRLPLLSYALACLDLHDINQALQEVINMPKRPPIAHWCT